MEKVCLIKQPAGIGDIFFCQKIAKLVLSKGNYNKIIWPVVQQYSYLNEYMGTEQIDFCSEQDDFMHKDLYHSNYLQIYKTDDVVYVPLFTSDRVITLPNPRAHGHMKYKFCNMSCQNWKDYFDFKRNYDREKALVERLGVDINEKYNIVNKNYGTFPDYLTREDVEPNNNYKNVYMDFYDDVRLFDWLTLFENAHEIHTMECGVHYLLEKLNLENVFIYSKFFAHADDDFSYMKDHCSEKWTYIK
jgi:hypothetical protein|tara:strand:+ start:10772 stop:11509 length:738 start_codon:yes stop_codon:yes gene_type:complete